MRNYSELIPFFFFLFRIWRFKCFPWLVFLTLAISSARETIFETDPSNPLSVLVSSTLVPSMEGNAIAVMLSAPEATNPMFEIATWPAVVIRMNFAARAIG